MSKKDRPSIKTVEFCQNELINKNTFAMLLHIEKGYPGELVKHPVAITSGMAVRSDYVAVTSDVPTSNNFKSSTR